MSQYESRTDEELFEQLKELNDKKAFQVLYARYNKRVFSYCVRCCGTREDAEDVFQTVISNIYEKRGSFRGGSFIAWLMTITRNQCLMAKRVKRPTSDIEGFAELIGDAGDKTGSDFLMREAVNDAIAKLPEEFREPIELRYFDDFSYEQIAEITGVSLSLVKVRLFRAKKMLLQMVAPYREEFQ
jgi:RNA polymerase sigma-70 factor (ECF subfamily)